MLCYGFASNNSVVESGFDTFLNSSLNNWSYISQNQKRQWDQENDQKDYDDENKNFQITNLVSIGDAG